MNTIRETLEQIAAVMEQNATAAPVQCVPPEELHLELTFKCNTQCIMCNLRYLEPGIAEMDYDTLHRALTKSILLKDMRFIVLSGGEAWLRDDFVSIVQLVREQNPAAHILMLSNLSDTELALTRLAQVRDAVGLQNMSIGSSLDGIGLAHDRIRGKKGCFEALERSLGRIKAEYPGLYFSLNFTVTPENCDQMIPVFHWCRERDYHVSFQVMVQKKETRQFRWTDDLCAVVDRQIDGIIGDMTAQYGLGEAPVARLLADEGLLSQMLGLHYIPRYLREPRRYYPACPCGEKFAMVDPAGDVYFCPVHKDRIAGNLKESSFDDIWLSEKAQDARRFFSERKCHCWLTCTNTHMIASAMRDGKQAFIRRLFDKTQAKE